MTYSTSAIILRRFDVGEWDRMYTAYTREHGKLRFIGKGTRRPRAKLVAALEPYSVVDLTLARGRQIDRVTSAILEHSGTRFTDSWDRVRSVAFLVECLDQFTKPDARDPALFELLADALHRVAAGAQVVTPFTLRFLALLGYAPQLDRCVECRREIPEGPVVSIPERGGVVCAHCRRSVHGGIILTATDRDLLRHACVAFVDGPYTTTVIQFTSRRLMAELHVPLRSPVPELTGM